MKLQNTNGFTFMELMIVIGIISILTGFVTVSLFNTKNKSSLNTTTLNLISDLKAQQLKAMLGDTESRATSDNYGVYFAGDRYILFHGNTYNPGDAANFMIQLGDSVTASTLFSGSQIIFALGSGEIMGYVNSANTITLTNTANGDEKTLQLNRYGVITND